jgi:hypothetical protein
MSTLQFNDEMNRLRFGRDYEQRGASGLAFTNRAATF